MESYEIRRLKQNDWQDYRDIRLESLALHPSFFSPSRDETKFTEADWKERIANPNAAAFGLFFSTEIVGLTGVVREGNQARATRAHLVSSYTRAEHRGQGLSRLFFEARIDWAQRQGDISTLVVEHRDDNLPSQKAHQKFGFRLVKTYERVWPDGASRPCLVYELNI